jgi:hypothetical protein
MFGERTRGLAIIEPCLPYPANARFPVSIGFKKSSMMAIATFSLSMPANLVRGDRLVKRRRIGGASAITECRESQTRTPQIRVGG